MTGPSIPPQPPTGQQTAHQPTGGNARDETGVPVRIRAIASEDLFQGQKELLIEHAGETYRLRLTRNGKLILNK